MRPPSLLFPVEICADTAQLSLITRAAAQIARQIFLDLLIGRVLLFAEQRDCVHHKAGIAEAALLRTLIRDERAEFGGFALQALKVVIVCPLARAASTEQDSTGFSSINTVHRPQFAVSQPRLTLRQP